MPNIQAHLGDSPIVPPGGMGTGGEGATASRPRVWGSSCLQACCALRVTPRPGPLVSLLLGMRLPRCLPMWLRDGLWGTVGTTTPVLRELRSEGDRLLPEC